MNNFLMVLIPVVTMIAGFCVGAVSAAKDTKQSFQNGWDAGYEDAVKKLRFQRGQPSLESSPHG